MYMWNDFNLLLIMYSIIDEVILEVLCLTDFTAKTSSPEHVTFLFFFANERVS